jgi:hypothetical protein
MKENNKYFEGNIYHASLVNAGLTDDEAKYVVNIISNKIRETKMNTYDHCFTINGKCDVHGMYENEITLKSGKKVKFAFNYD